MLRQNQTGTMATKNISAKPTAKRFICGSAQGDKDPPATEKSIKNPMPATVVKSSARPQLK